MDLKRAIKDKGFSISKVADELGITQSALSQQINNNTISLARTKEIASIIGVSLSELVSDDMNALSVLCCPFCGKPLQVTISGKE